MDTISEGRIDMVGDNTEAAQMPTCWSCGAAMKSQNFGHGGAGWICTCGVTEMPMAKTIGKRPAATKAQGHYSDVVSGRKKR